MGKLINIIINKMLPKFTMVVDGKKEKYNSVMALNKRIAYCEKNNIEYSWREMW